MKRIAGSLLVLSMGCVGPADVPSNVRDLRVLGVQLEPPELMAETCTSDLDAFTTVAGASVVYTALIADPAGDGRAIEAELRVCASTDDRTCETPGERYVLQPLPPLDEVTGELSTTLPALGETELPDGPLLLKVRERDPYGGLGGLRVPLVLHLRAGEEEIYAQKLMLYSCYFTPEQTQNVNPELPGVRVSGAAWGPADVPILEGPGPFPMDPEPFDGRQERYFVPSFQLETLEMKESWKIAWHADYGQFSPQETGGTDLGGVEARHHVEWSPPEDAIERDVRFWMVVRDGRGGSSWLARTAHYRP
jgi:hypothetical protein